MIGQQPDRAADQPVTTLDLAKAYEAAANAVTKIPPIEPLSDNVLVRPDSKDVLVKTPALLAAGFFVDDAIGAKPLEGVVVAVGPGGLLDTGVRDPVGVVPGDRVRFRDYAWQKGTFEVEGEKLLLMRGVDIVWRYKREEIPLVAPGAAIAAMPYGISVVTLDRLPYGKPYKGAPYWPPRPADMVAVGQVYYVMEDDYYVTISSVSRK